MAVGFTLKRIRNGGLSASQTDNFGGAASYAAGTRILVLATATREEVHTSGLGASFGIDDDMGLDWTKVVQGDLFLGAGANFAQQTNIWLSSVLASAEASGAVTVDGNTGGTQQYYYGGQIFELSADGDISVVQAHVEDGATTNPTLSISSPTAGNLQVCYWSAVRDGSATWPAAPTNFTKVTGGANTGVGTPSQSATSTTNTATSIAYNGGGGGTEYGAFSAYIELADSGGSTPEGSAGYPVDVALAATGSRDSDGSADLPVDVTLAATGSRDSDGAAGHQLDVALAAAGSRDSDADAAHAIDVTLAATGARDSAGATDLPIDVALAATGARDSDGTADLPVTLTLAATGSAPAAPGAATADLPVDVTLAAAGSRDSDATAGHQLDLALTATGARGSSGAVDLPLELALAAVGSRSSAATTDLPLELALVAVGSTPSVAGGPATFTGRTTAAAGMAATADPAAQLTSTATEEARHG